MKVKVQILTNTFSKIPFGKGCALKKASVVSSEAPPIVSLRASPLSLVASLGVCGSVGGRCGFLGTPSSPCPVKTFGLRGWALMGLLVMSC